KGFEPVMVPPKGSVKLGGSAAALGASPVLVYVNDYGGQPTLTFKCSDSDCQVDESKRDK
ncbi:fimbrial biogenesis chaperone, partial [Serratia fonticola]